MISDKEKNLEDIYIYFLSPPISAGSPQNIVEVHVTHFGKPIAYGFVIFFQENWMNKTCTGSQEAQKLWQIEATFQHKKP